MIQTALPHPGSSPVLVMSLRHGQLSGICSQNQCKHFVLVFYSFMHLTCILEEPSFNQGWGNTNPEMIFVVFFNLSGEHIMNISFQILPYLTSTHLT
jgi:hypothetical protein